MAPPEHALVLCCDEKSQAQALDRTQSGLPLKKGRAATLDQYIAHHNADPKPFIWTKSARDILQKVIRANSRLSSKQNATLH